MQDQYGIPQPLILANIAVHSSRVGIQFKGKKPAEEVGPTLKGLKPKTPKYWFYHLHLIFYRGTKRPGSAQKLTLFIAAINLSNDLPWKSSMEHTPNRDLSGGRVETSPQR